MLFNVFIQGMTMIRGIGQHRLRAWVEGREFLSVQSTAWKMSKRVEGAAPHARPRLAAVLLCSAAWMALSLVSQPGMAKKQEDPVHAPERKRNSGNGRASGEARLDTIQVKGAHLSLLPLPGLMVSNAVNFNAGGGAGGGGVVFKGATGEKQDVDNASENEPCGGNPILFTTGNKIEPETDFVSAGEMGLSLTRTYNHYWSYKGLFGAHWLSSFDYSLSFQTAGGENRIWAQRPDGRRIKYVRVGSSNRWNEDKPGPVAFITQSGSTYTLTSEYGEVETYNAQGYVTSVRNPQGIGWTYTYSNATFSNYRATDGWGYSRSLAAM